MRYFREMTVAEFGEMMDSFATRLEHFYRRAIELETFEAWVAETDAGTDALVADMAVFAGSQPLTLATFAAINARVQRTLKAEGLTIPEWSEVSDETWQAERARIAAKPPQARVEL